MAERTRRHILEPGGTIGANAALGAELKAWLERSGRQASGAIVIGLFGEGFELQYMGAENITARALEDRVLWIADQIREARR